MDSFWRVQALNSKNDQKHEKLLAKELPIIVVKLFLPILNTEIMF